MTEFFAGIVSLLFSMPNKLPFVNIEALVKSNGSTLLGVLFLCSFFLHPWTAADSHERLLAAVFLHCALEGNKVWPVMQLLERGFSLQKQQGGIHEHFYTT